MVEFVGAISGHDMSFTAKRVLGEGAFGVVTLGLLKDSSGFGTLVVEKALRQGASDSGMSPIWEEILKYGRMTEDLKASFRKLHNGFIGVCEMVDYYKPPWIGTAVEWSRNSRIYITAYAGTIDQLKLDPVGDQFNSFARDIITGLEFLNYCGIVHNDIKPANICFDGFVTGIKRAYIVDCGECTSVKTISGASEEELRSEYAGLLDGYSEIRPRYVSSNGPDVGVKYSIWRPETGPVNWSEANDGYGRKYFGTRNFASVDIHAVGAGYARSDLESLAYTLIKMAGGKLPWEDLESWDKVYEMKTRYNTWKFHSGTPKAVGRTSATKLTKIPSVREFIAGVYELRADDKPNYELLRSAFM